MDILRIETGLRVLNSGIDLFETWYKNPHPRFRRIALKEKTKALINHDRFLNNEIVKRGVL